MRAAAYVIELAAAELDPQPLQPGEVSERPQQRRRLLVAVEPQHQLLQLRNHHRHQLHVQLRNRGRVAGQVQAPQARV